MATVSRLVLAHPALGATGGASLHAAVEALYQKIGDAIANRWYQLTDFDNGETVDLEHDFDTDITNLRWDIYIFTGGQWTRVTTTSSPARSDFTVVEKTGDEDITLQITNVSGGNDLLAAVVVTNDPLAFNEGDVTDVDVTSVPPADGDTLTYETASGKWKPVAGSITAGAQDFSGLKRFLGGISSAEYVGTDPEVGGASPFQLTVAHKRIQTINPAGAITVKLPTTSVKAGERWRIVNRAAFDVTVQSSGANSLGVLYKAAGEFVALQDTPTTAAHWAPVESTGPWKLYVGRGPGAYATLTAAIAAAVAGDTILVMESFSEAADVSLSVADVLVRFMPGAVMTLAGALTNGLRLTAARVRVESLKLKLESTGATARGLSIEAADCWVDGRVETNTAQTYTDLLHITSAGVRAYAHIGVLRTLGTITNPETNNNGAVDTLVVGG